MNSVDVCFDELESLYRGKHDLLLSHRVSFTTGDRVLVNFVGYEDFLYGDSVAYNDDGDLEFKFLFLQKIVDDGGLVFRTGNGDIKFFMAGTVVAMDKDSYGRYDSVPIQFSSYVDGNNLGGRVYNDHGLWINSFDILPFSEIPVNNGKIEMPDISISINSLS